MKVLNEYLHSLPDRLYERTPKAVFAALAVSYANRIGSEDMDDLSPEKIGAEILNEWRVLHANGIVPQSPPKETK